MKVVRIIIRTRAQTLHKIVLQSTYEKRILLVSIQYKMYIAPYIYSFMHLILYDMILEICVFSDKISEKNNIQRNTCRVYILKTIRLIWQFRFVLAFFYDDFRKRKLLSTHSTREFVRFVNYIKMELRSLSRIRKWSRDIPGYRANLL